MAARWPAALSKPRIVSVPPPAISAYELALSKASMPTVRLASTVTARAAAAGPKYAVCPAALATPPLCQLLAPPHAPEVVLFQIDQVGGATRFTAYCVVPFSRLSANACPPSV